MQTPDTARTVQSAPLDAGQTLLRVSLSVGWAEALLVGAVALHVFMFFSLFFGYLDPLFDNSDLQPKGIDFFSIYQGGLYALENHSIYDWTAVDGVPYAAPYRYLPFFAYTAGVALTVIPPWTGYWLWVSLIEVMLVFNAWQSYRLAEDRRWGLIAAAMWFAFTPLYLELYMGQWSFLMATLMLLTAIGLMRGSEAGAGAPWLASVLAKTNSALLGAIFLRMRYWRAIAGAGVLLLALNAPYFIARPDDWDLFARMNLRNLWFHEELTPALLASGDLSGTAWLQTVWFSFDPDGTGMPAIVKRTFVIAIIGGSFAVTLLPRKLDIVAAFATWTCAYFLAYLSVWEHHFVMMLPALALLVALRPQYRPIALFAFVFIALPTPYFIIENTVADGELTNYGSPQFFWPSWAGILHHSAKTVPMFVLWLSLVWTELDAWWRERRALAPEAAASAG